MFNVTITAAKAPFLEKFAIFTKLIHSQSKFMLETDNLASSLRKVGDTDPFVPPLLLKSPGI